MSYTEQELERAYYRGVVIVDTGNGCIFLLDDVLTDARNLAEAKQIIDTEKDKQIASRR